jgi:hypothetical protein
MPRPERTHYLTARQKSLIHVAKARLGLDDETYRNLLERVCGVRSARDVHPRHFPFLMEMFAELGFTSDFAAKAHGHREEGGMATPAQVTLIRELWKELHGGELDERHLGNWLGRFGVSHLRFADFEVARKAITALRAWKRRKAKEFTSA